MFKLRNYQNEIANKALEILISKGIVYLALEVRVGKTATSLEICRLYNAKSVLFITKLKAISSIESDYKNFGFDFELIVVNYESVHKVGGDFDLIICDESHKNGAYPKPNTVTKAIKERFSDKPFILLSGTPTPEGWSQIYHQFWISDKSPFSKFTNFYKWANDYVDKKDKYVSYGKITDYSNARYDSIKPILDQYMISFTQKDAGFSSEISENILEVQMKPITYDLIKRLKKNLVIQGKEEVILADTSVKLMSKVHQLFSGTVKFESGNSKIIDDSKALFIKDRFSGQKIGIFYKFIEEYNLLKQVFGDYLTNNLEEFDSTDKNIALQIVSGREGLSLKNAKSLVYFNIDFSATSYWQSRDRMTTMDRLENDVYWIFAKGGIERFVYKSVINKKDYTLKHFEKDARKLHTE